jgi:hypothetical protein
MKKKPDPTVKQLVRFLARFDTIHQLFEQAISIRGRLYDEPSESRVREYHEIYGEYLRLKIKWLKDIGKFETSKVMDEYFNGYVEPKRKSNARTRKG